MLEFRRLPLKGLVNCRELGGFATEDGGRTRYGVFLRSEVPALLPREDIEYLREYGVTDCMDFRTEDERKRNINVLEKEEFINYYPVPMYEKHMAPSGQVKKFDPEEVFIWSELYTALLKDYRDWVKTILEIAAGAKGACLYNCTTGKDRTGMCSMLLFSIAGVPKPDIVTDYCVSMVYMRDRYDTLNFGGTLPANLRITPPEGMGDTIDNLEREFGSVTEYIRACGVSDETIRKIHDKLVEY